MTREELVNIMGYSLPVYHDENGVREAIHEEIADRILAALEKEREGEKVLGEGKIGYNFQTAFDDFTATGEILGKRGSLIFRPTPAEKEGV